MKKLVAYQYTEELFEATDAEDAVAVQCCLDHGQDPNTTICESALSCGKACRLCDGWGGFQAVATNELARHDFLCLGRARTLVAVGARFKCAPSLEGCEQTMSWRPCTSSCDLA